MRGKGDSSARRVCNFLASTPPVSSSARSETLALGSEIPVAAREQVSTHLGLGRALCGRLEECGQIGEGHARPGFVVGSRDASWQSLVHD